MRQTNPPHLSTPAAAMSSTHWAGCVTIRCASSNALVCFRRPLITFTKRRKSKMRREGVRVAVKTRKSLGWT